MSRTSDRDKPLADPSISSSMSCARLSVKPLTIHAQAEAEVLMAVAYYEGRRKGLGSAFRQEFEKALIRIQSTPEAWLVVDDQGTWKHRFRRFPYTIYYAFRPRERTFLFPLVVSVRLFAERVFAEYPNDREAVIVNCLLTVAWNKIMTQKRKAQACMGWWDRELAKVDRGIVLSRVNHSKAGIAFFRALANNAASSGEASSAKDCGGWTAHGSRSRVDRRSRPRLKVWSRERNPPTTAALPRRTRQSAAWLV